MALNPLTLAVLDAGGHLLAMERRDGSSSCARGWRMAHGKACGALAMGLGGRALFNRARDRLFRERLQRAGGRRANARAEGASVGAVGISGDISDQDEIAVVAGIEAVGLAPATGA